MGYEGVKTLIDNLDGKEVPRLIDTGVTLVTNENIQTPQIKAQLKQMSK